MISAMIKNNGENKTNPIIEPKRSRPRFHRGIFRTKNGSIVSVNPTKK
jgi:hypothetical protein